MSKYSVGLRNVGSYRVSGHPYITGSVVNDGSEVKVEFPFVTKEVKTRFVSSTAGSIHISVVRNLIGGMNFSDDDTSGGIDNQFNIPYSKDLENNPATIAMWFNPQSGISGNYVFIGASGIPTNIAVRYHVASPGTGNVNFILSMFGISATEAVTGITDDEWHHFAFVVDSGADLLSVYVNGQLIHSDSITSYHNVTNWAIPVFDGVVENWAEYTFFDTALDATQISNLYNGGNPRDPSVSFGSTLEHWYRFNDSLSPPDTTTTVHDRIGTANATIGPGGFPKNNTFIAGPESSVKYNRHYYQLKGQGDSVTLPMKTKELYLTAVGSQITFEVIAELTNIPTGSMYALAGSGIDE